MQAAARESHIWRIFFPRYLASPPLDNRICDGLFNDSKNALYLSRQELQQPEILLVTQ